jgi:hypothetical protein
MEEELELGWGLELAQVWALGLEAVDLARVDEDHKHKSLLHHK